MRSARTALALAATLTAIAIVLTLHGAPMSVAGTNGIPDAGEVATTQRATSACQGAETVPAGTTAVRLTLAAEIGPRVIITARSAEGTITHGIRGAGWTGAAVTVHVQRVAHTARGAQLCFALARPLEEIELFGRHTTGPDALIGPRGERLPGRLGVEYLQSGHTSWLSLAPSIARRMGFGHAWGGAWIVFALAVVMASAAGLMAWLALRGTRGEQQG
jgi:hypothetical protein